MANYLITGGAGFIGSMLTRKLLIGGDSIWILDNPLTGKKENIPDGVNFINGSVYDEEIYNKLEGLKVDAIFYFAAQSFREIFYEKQEYDVLPNVKHFMREGLDAMSYGSSVSMGQARTCST